MCFSTPVPNRSHPRSNDFNRYGFRFLPSCALSSYCSCCAACTSRSPSPAEIPPNRRLTTPCRLPTTPYRLPTCRLQPASHSTYSYHPSPSNQSTCQITFPRDCGVHFSLPQGYFATSDADGRRIPPGSMERPLQGTPNPSPGGRMPWSPLSPPSPARSARKTCTAPGMGKSSGPFAGLPLLMDEETRTVLSAWWGEPADGAVQVLPAETLVDTAWAQRPAWAIVPFEALEPRWKVLSVDGISPLSRDFDPASYALSVPFALTTPPGLYDWSLPAGNRDPNQLTIVDMTGVTALVRGTALWMERYGITYPAQDIGSLLASADITHINNEVPFHAGLPLPGVGLALADLLQPAGVHRAAGCGRCGCHRADRRPFRRLASGIHGPHPVALPGAWHGDLRRRSECRARPPAGADRAQRQPAGFHRLPHRRRGQNRDALRCPGDCRATRRSPVRFRVAAR